MSNLYTLTLGHMNQSYDGMNPKNMQWKVNPYNLQKFGTVYLDETDSQMRDKSKKIGYNDNYGAIVGGKWVFILPEEDAKDGWDIFECTKFQLMMGDVIIESICAKSYPLLSKLYGGGTQKKRKMIHNPQTKTVQFEFPFLFSVFQFNNGLPLVPSNHKIQFLNTFTKSALNGQYFNKLLQQTCIVEYLNDSDPFALSNFTLNSMSQIFIYQKQYDSTIISKGKTECRIRLMFSYPTVGIYFNLSSTTKGLKAKLQHAEFKINMNYGDYKEDIVVVKESKEMLNHKCDQFMPNQHSHITKINCEDSKSLVFPVEIWALIFGHLKDPRNLMMTCKYLWKISHYSSIRSVICEKMDKYLPNWYCMPFNNGNKLDQWVMKDTTLNLTRVDQNYLDLTFAEPLKEDVHIFTVGIGFNILKFYDNVFGVVYST